MTTLIVIVVILVVGGIGMAIVMFGLWSAVSDIESEIDAINEEYSDLHEGGEKEETMWPDSMV